MSHDEEIARPPARTLFDVVFDRHSYPPPLVELYCLNPVASSSQSLRGPSLWTRVRRNFASFAVLRQRDMEKHHAYERTAARPYMHNVLLQEHGVKRMRVQVQRQWLLQYPDGKIAFFVLNSSGPPLFVPVLRVIREREAWMNMRLTKRTGGGKDEPQMYVGGRYNTSTGLFAEYELVRTDGRVLEPDDIIHEPFALHDEIGKLKRAARKKRVDPVSELHGFVTRLPRKYQSVGVRVYNPTKPKWKMQLVWMVMIGFCAFFVLLFLSTLATYWPHIEEVGVDVFVDAYLVQTLLIQAFACEFREMFNIVFANFVVSELLLLLCCLRCASTDEQERLGLKKSGERHGSGHNHNAVEAANARSARSGNARGLERMLSRQATLSDLVGLADAPLIDPRLLEPDAERLLFEQLRAAISRHAIAISKMRGAKRTRRLRRSGSRAALEGRLEKLVDEPEWGATRRSMLSDLIDEFAAEAQRPELIDPERRTYEQLVALLSDLLNELLPVESEVMAPSTDAATNAPPVVDTSAAASSQLRMARAPPPAALAEAMTGPRRVPSCQSSDKAVLTSMFSPQDFSKLNERTRVTQAAGGMAEPATTEPSPLVDPSNNPRKLGRLPTGLPPYLRPGVLASARPPANTCSSSLPPPPPPRSTRPSHPEGGSPAEQCVVPPALTSMSSGLPPATDAARPTPPLETSEAPAQQAEAAQAGAAQVQAVKAEMEPNEASKPRTPPEPPPRTRAMLPPEADVASRGDQASLSPCAGVATPPPSPPASESVQSAPSAAEGAGLKVGDDASTGSDLQPRPANRVVSSSMLTPEVRVVAPVVRESTRRSTLLSFVRRSTAHRNTAQPLPSALERSTSSGARTSSIRTSSSDSLDGRLRFIPGRAGVTLGYLLPLGRELQFNFEEPPDTDTAECDRFYALMLLSCWEETVEALCRASFWSANEMGSIQETGSVFKAARVEQVSMHESVCNASIARPRGTTWLRPTCRDDRSVSSTAADPSHVETPRPAVDFV